MTESGDHGYRLGELLGQGGMASVFEATRTWDGERVALKVLRDGAALDHPSIVRLIDLDEHPELGLFLVAELVIWSPRLLHAEAHVACFRGDHLRGAHLLADATLQLEKWPWGRWAVWIERAELAASMGRHDDAASFLADARTATGPRDAKWRRQLGEQPT